MIGPGSLRVGLGLLLALSLAAVAQEDSQLLQTDWLELVKGYRGNTVGAQVLEVEEGEQTGTQKLTLAIPKSYFTDRNEIEEVMVIGRRPGKSAPLLDVTYEWVEDYDNDNYGLVIRLSKDSKWPIRLYMYSDTGFTR